MARGKGDPFEKRLGVPRTTAERRARHKKLYGPGPLPPRGTGMRGSMVGPGPRTGIPPVAPMAPGIGPQPGTRRAAPSPLKQKGQPLSSFMPGPKKLKRGKKGRKSLLV